jgi:type VI secretion system protein ImpA
MPVTLREDLLKPIAGDNPAGKSLRYDPVYDKIKEARREEDDAPQGEWQRERKTADWGVVIKLASDSIADKSKDLQLAAWLTEALLRKDGFSGLLRGLTLMRGMIDEFWDNLYPENEDGDLELRAAPVDWVGTYLEQPVKNAPITKSGLGYFKYKESRSVGYEEQANESSSKREAYDTAKRDGKMSADDFDAAVRATSTATYGAWMEDFDKSLETLTGLDEVCQEKFGDYSPSFSKLRSALEEVRNVVRGIFLKRQEAEAPPPPTAAEPEPEPEPVSSHYAAPAAAAPAPAPAKTKVAGGIVPATLDEVPLRLAAVAKYLRANDAYDPAPYLMLRGYRWGETRRQGSHPHPSFIVAPSTEARQTIRRLAADANWGELIEAGEAAMAEPCGRAWMDLQRYMVKALEGWGCPVISAAIRAELRALITDIPEIANWTFDDDTPVANGETQAWLKELAGPVEVHAAAPPPASPEPAYQPPPPPRRAAETFEADAPPDPYELAMEKVKRGRVDEAIEMLAQDIALQQSGRGRFQSKVNFCQLCLATNREALAMPILEELVETIDHHRLESWEPPDSIAHPLSLLYRCLDKAGAEPAMKHKIYARICRLDPMQALSFAR